MYFNTLIPVDSAVIKYGVVSLDTMKKDLTDWNTLYIAGRLHKPVDTLITNESISLAQNENIAAAMRVAMLLCPQTFNMAELLRIICSLSYIGDVRLGFAEDSRKVQRIVSGMYLFAVYTQKLNELGNYDVLDFQTAGSKTELFQLYHGSMITALDSNMLTLLGPSESVINLRSVFRNTLTLNSKSELYASLPEHVIHRIVTQKRGDKLPRAMRSVDHDTRRKALGEYIASSPYGALALQRALASIVRRSSFRQACLGIVSAGPLRSLRYVSAKVAKFLSSRR